MNNYELNNILKDVWHQVHGFYNDERINSERCLQAILYHLLSLALYEKNKNDIVIHVEPNLHTKAIEKFAHIENCIPDLLISNNKNNKEKSIIAIFEIKFTNQWNLSTNHLNRDIGKLIDYSEMKGTRIELDTFGPNRRFDEEEKKWQKFDKYSESYIDGRDKYKIAEDCLFCFAVISNKFDKAVQPEHLKGLIPDINFCHMYGALDINERASFFGIKNMPGMQKRKK